jgi:hypothetical protein
LPNPFAKGSEDLKAESVSSKRDSALAEHFKAMAADPYGTLAKMQDEEVERQSLGGIPYDGEIHKLNPFLGITQLRRPSLFDVTLSLPSFISRKRCQLRFRCSVQSGT